MPETQGSADIPGILSEIVASKRREVARLRDGMDDVRAALADAPAPRDFAGALSRAGEVALIAEVKRRSPGAGAIRPELDPGRLAAAYEAAGAAALSVLTDAPFFGGSSADLSTARAAVALPVLRKDFVLEEIQLLEARAMGADAVLLIVRILNDATLRRLLAVAQDLGLAALVEAHDAEDVARAVQAGAHVLGINNRDLASFQTGLEVSLGLAGAVPRDTVLVSESGIRTPADVARLGEAGVDAILVGEALLRQRDPAAAARALVGLTRSSTRG